MTTYPAGSAPTLTVQWFQYPGGPAAAVTGVTVTITRLSDLVVVVGPTSAGVVQVAVGLNAYQWAIPGDASGDYAVVWDGTDSTPETVQTSDVVTVGAADFTYDPAGSTGQIRLLISDTDPTTPTFSDAEITAFYAMSGSNVRLGAATALEAIAGNELLVAKVIKTLDLETSGDKMSAELRNLAKSLREQAAEYLPDGTLFAMDVVDFRPDLWWLNDAEQAEQQVC